MAEKDLMVESRGEGGRTVVDLKGEVDLYTAPRLKEELVSRIEAGEARIVVNLEGVAFLDSAGLGVLIGALKRCRERDGELALAGPKEPVRKVLSITGLERVFPIHDTVAEALGA